MTPPRPLPVTRYRAYVAGAWLLFATIVGVFVTLELLRIENEALAVARERGATLFQLVETTRTWNARHGGVYVPVGEYGVPNPYLELPNRDVTTTGGQRLTLVNPAYMTRQIAELAESGQGARIHITSLRPLRPQNAADAWERATLEAFERDGLRERIEPTTVDGRPAYRYMAPLRIEPACLQCHNSHDYRVGDIRGGISITMPATRAYGSVDDDSRATLLSGLASFLLLGGLAHLVLHRHRLMLRRLSDLTAQQARELDVRTAELARERARYQTMAELSSDWFWEQDEHCRFAAFSGDHNSKGGLPVDKLIGKKHWEIPLLGVPPEEMAHHRSAVEARREFAGFEYQILNANDELRWYSASGRPQYDEQGRFRGYIGTGIDVTARKRRESMLHTLSHDTASVFGQRFFATLAESLRKLLGARYCMIARLPEHSGQARVVVLSDAANEHALQHYPIQDSPCTWVLAGDICVFPDNADEAFPGARLLRELGAKSYVGVPIGASAARPLGVLAVMDTKALKLEQDIIDLVKIFATRAMLEFERMDAEDALRESSRLLNLAEKMAGVGSWEVDVGDRSMLWSEETFRIFGLDRRGFECTFDNYLGRTHPTDRPLVRETFEAALKDGGTFEVEHRIVLPTGGIRTVLQRGEVRCDDDGQPTSVHGMVQNITERRAAEEKLSLAASVFSATHDGVLITDPDGTILDANPSLCRMSGYDYQELVGRSPRIFRSDRHPKSFFVQLWKSLTELGHWEGEIWNRRKDGSVVPERLTISAVRDDSGRTTHFIGVHTDISALKAHQRELERQAYHDPLTGLPNRRLLIDRLHQSLAQAGRSGSMVAVAFIDLDGFKAVNDRLGHDAGDELLIEVGRRLGATVRAGDTVARLGGDEFVLLVGIASPSEIAATLERVLADLRRPATVAGGEARVGASVGVAIHPEDGRDPEILLQRADAAMYEAKHAGRNRYCLYRGAGTTG